MADINGLINSLKGISGTGGLLNEVSQALKDANLTMEPGDFASKDIKVAAPIGYDVWYLWAHDNFMAHYYTDQDPNHKDYTEYMNDCMDFLAKIPRLKPLRVLRNVSQILGTTVNNPFEVFGERTEWTNNGIYWINTLAFELWLMDQGMQFASDGPKGYAPNDYVGYISFPVGQLGVMEVISLLQETKLASDAEDGKITMTDEAIAVNPPEIFPPRSDASGYNHSGQNYCYGTHLIEGAYLVPDAVIRDMEPMASPMAGYAEDVKPKKWMRYWIHKSSKLPVPGEFIGVLCKPVATPPHVWWFQESSPFIYAGNWVETGNLTSGEVITVTLEADRTDGGVGDEYEVLIQGCLVTVYASDFFRYEVGDRVAIIKVDSTAAAQTQSFTWLAQPTLKETDEGTIKTNYIIIPATFYRAA